MTTPTMQAFTLKPGEEQHHEYFSDVLKRYMVQYDYRSKDGRLFSTVAPTLETAKERRNRWLLDLPRFTTPIV